MQKIGFRQIFIIFWMGLAYAVVYATPFIQYVFYDDLASALSASNTQLGYLITIFGVGNILAIIGGQFADRFNTKKIYVISMLLVCGLNFLFAANLNYKFALFVWAGFAVSGLFLYFPAHTKLVRLLASEEQQGTAYGLTEAFCGVASVIINAIALALYTKFCSGALGGVAGLRAAIIGYGVVGLISTITIIFLVPNDLEEKGMGQEAAKEKITTKDWLDILKDPRTWMSGIAVFSTYTLYTTISYFTPYFTGVLGVTVVFSGAISVIRQYGTRFVGAPIGGVLGDRIKSVSKVVGIGNLVGAIIIIIFLLCPKGTSQYLLIGLTIILGFFLYMSRGSMFAVPSELKIERRLAGSTSGLVCAIGYCPDLFIFVLYGHWLDKMGNAGYTKIFVYCIIILLIGFANTVLAQVYKKKHGLK